MVTRTFLSRCTTIFKDNECNFGLNPIGMLNYGRLVSRSLIYFDESKIIDLLTNGSCLNTEKVTHTLKLTNCGSIDARNYNEFITSKDDKCIKKRATSFDIILFKIPYDWDCGVGFDDSSDFWLTGDGAISYEGCNWYQCYNGKEWDEEGIFSTDKLSKEYTKFGNGEESIIVARQHFDYGNEDFEFDITKYINGLLNGDINRGLCLAFTPITEETEQEYTQYVGFFTNKTNTFFKPYVETRIDDAIKDDRYDFKLGKENRLYFYSNIDGAAEDLDEIPTCTIDGENYSVTKQTTGVYYATVNLSKDGHEEDEILYDEWSIKYNGDEENIEQEFVTKKNSISASENTSLNTSVSLVGINDSERVNGEGTRELETIFKIPYTCLKDKSIKEAYYRLYIIDASKKELDVINWDNINFYGNKNSFNLNIDELFPNEYHVDIKAKKNGAWKYFKNELKFRVVNNMSKIRH